MAKKVNRITDEQREQIRAMLLSTDKSNRQIAREMRVSDHTVRRIRAEIPEKEITEAHLVKKKNSLTRPGRSLVSTLPMCRRIRLLPKPTPATVP